MNKQDIEKYLRMLGQEVLKQQVTGEILLAGGAVQDAQHFWRRPDA